MGNRPRIFVNSMSDVFHEAVPAEFVAAVWREMRATPQHTYQILTKQLDRMTQIRRSDKTEAADAPAVRATRWPAATSPLQRGIF